MSIVSEKLAVTLGNARATMIKPRLSIVTPTILRSTLKRLCDSIDRQTNQDFEHVLVVDIPIKEIHSEQKSRLDEVLNWSNRFVSFCDKRHQNYGNTCRHKITPKLKGEYVLYIDDDDYLSDAQVLETLAEVYEPWAIFPIYRWGRPYLVLPPGICKTGNAMYIYRKELATFPDNNTYEADGMLVEELIKKAPYQVLNCRPLVVMPVSNHGVYL